MARLTRWVARTGRPVVRVRAEAGSGRSGARSEAKRLLADPAVTTVLEHKDRLGRMNVDLIEAALSVSGLSRRARLAHIQSLEAAVRAIAHRPSLLVGEKGTRRAPGGYRTVACTGAP